MASALFSVDRHAAGAAGDARLCASDAGHTGGIDTRLASLEVEFAALGSEQHRGDPGAGPSGPSDPSA